MKAVMAAKNPFEIKEIGKKVKGFNQNKWLKVADNVMTDCNFQKVILRFPIIFKERNNFGIFKIGIKYFLTNIFFLLILVSSKSSSSPRFIFDARNTFG